MQTVVGRPGCQRRSPGRLARARCLAVEDGIQESFDSEPQGREVYEASASSSTMRAVEEKPDPTRRREALTGLDSLLDAAAVE
jgi:hypothetical protein